MSDAGLEQLLSTVDHGVLVTLQRDGRPQLSNVNHHYDPVTRRIRISVTAGRAKTRNLARDQRAGYHVTTADFWHWAGVDARAELGPVAQAPDDEAVDALIDLYRAIAGEHPDWDDYRRAMVADQRQVLTLHVERLYGQP